MPSCLLRLIAVLGLLLPALAWAGPFVTDNSPAAPGGADTGSSSSGLVATDPLHVLQPQDVIKVEIFQEDDLNKQCDGLSISQDSSVTLPLIGRISVKDKTVRQAEEIIRQLYDKDYLVNPQVTVSIVKYADRTVNVMGSVTKQGRIDFPPARGLTIVDAISLAGGQTRLADLKHVKLTRTNPKGESVVKEIDVDAIMKRGGTEPVMLKPGDVIYVPERIL